MGRPKKNAGPKDPYEDLDKEYKARAESLDEAGLRDQRVARCLAAGLGRHGEDAVVADRASLAAGGEVVDEEVHLFSAPLIDELSAYRFAESVSYPLFSFLVQTLAEALPEEGVKQNLKMSITSPYCWVYSAFIIRI